MKQQAAIFLLAAVLASATAVTSSTPPTGGSPMRSRLLAAFGPKTKKCTIDPSTCYGLDGQVPTCCGDSCVNTQTDPVNCGKCGKVCKFADTCCNGKCVDLNSDKNHCGSCFNQCKHCAYGMCDYA